MITYVDSSVLLARYLVEERSEEASLLLEDATYVVASRIAHIEVRRGLSFVVSAAERLLAQSIFAEEWKAVAVVECDPGVADLAGTIAAKTRVRSLDAIHVASALIAGCERFLTLDHSQADTALQFELDAVGVSS